MSGDKILISLDDACAWARGEITIRIRFPNGVSSEVSMQEYRVEMARQREQVRRLREKERPCR